MPARPQRRATYLLMAGIAMAGGCTFGPKTLERTHGQYHEAVRRVELEQLLTNVVLVRYGEVPLNLNVNSITAQYELTAGAEARPFFGTPNPADNIFRTFPMVLPDLMFQGSNRPTFSLDPADGSDAVRQYLTPISADFLVFLTQTSWPAATVLRLWVERVNGVPNAVPASGPPRDAPADFTRFQRAVDLLQIAQDQELAAVRTEERDTVVGGPLPAEAVTGAATVEAAKAGLEYHRAEDGRTWTLVRKERRLIVQVTPGAEHHPVLAEIEALFNLVPGLSRYDLVTASRGNPDPARVPTPPATEFRVVTRSTAQVLFYLANGVEVPAEHFACGLVPPQTAADGRTIDGREITRGLFEVKVCCGKKPPPTAYVAVPYRGYWFYIDDRDAQTKATFGLMLELSRVDFARQPPGAKPVLTLPAGR